MTSLHPFVQHRPSFVNLPHENTTYSMSNKGVKPHLLFSRCLCTFGYTFSGSHSGGETVGQLLLLLFFRSVICSSFCRFSRKTAAQLVAGGRERVIARPACGRRRDPLIAFCSQCRRKKDSLQVSLCLSFYLPSFML